MFSSLLAAALLFSTTSAGDDAPQTKAVAIKTAEVTIYDSRLRPAFTAKADYVASLATWSDREPERRGKYLLVSGDGESALWIHCSQVQAEACADATSARRGPIAVRAAGIPVCPGDPRCPAGRPGAK